MSSIQNISLKGRLYKNLASEPKDRYELFEKVVHRTCTELDLRRNSCSR